MANYASTAPLIGGLNQTSPGLIRSGSFVADIEVSIKTSESHKVSSSPTDISIENGATVSDHVILKPDEVTIMFAMANTRGGAEAARAAFEEFEKLVKERVLFDLITEHKFYKNVVATSISAEHKAPYKGALTCTVTLRQITQIDMQRRGRANAGSVAIKKTAAPQADAGQQAGRKVSPDSMAAGARK